MAQTEVRVKLDLPEGVELLGYERCGEGYGFEVKFPLPLYCRPREVPQQGARQEHFAPFRRKKVMCTYRFEEYLLKDLYDVRVQFKEIFACGARPCDGGGTTGRTPRANRITRAGLR